MINNPECGFRGQRVGMENNLADKIKEFRKHIQNFKNI